MEPLLLNVFLNCKLCNYPDKYTLYFIAKNLSVVKSDLEYNFLVMHKWSHKNNIVLTPGKCHYMPDRITISLMLKTFFL